MESNFMNKTMTEMCPCNSSKPFNACCEPIIKGRQKAQTAQALMQSRYTAYCMGDVDYLMISHHATTRPIKERKQIEKWAKSVQWLGLKIVSTDKGSENDINGMVEFKATYIENGQIQQIHEKSLFKKENNQWKYVSGIHY